MVIVGIDSSYAKPTAQLVAQFRAAGVKMWSGYLTTKSGVGIAAPWSQADFDLAKQLGAIPLAFCSGWDDPIACKALAAAWGVRLCLDVENSIRGFGSWVQGWLDASGAGVYGNIGVHGVSAPFHILSAYPGVQENTTWFSGYTKPNTPCGWQYQGTHVEFGIEVDTGNYDDWFAQGIINKEVEDGDMIQIQCNAPGGGIALLGSTFCVNVENAANATALAAAGVPIAEVDLPLFQVLLGITGNAGSALEALLTEISAKLDQVNASVQSVVTADKEIAANTDGLVPPDRQGAPQ